jgi:Glycosyltransferase family 9 (heptosyltransferase)
MLLFYVTEPLDVAIRNEHNGRPVEWSLRLHAPADGRVSGDSLHFATWPELKSLNESLKASGREAAVKILALSGKLNVMGRAGMPKLLGYYPLYRYPWVPLDEQLAALDVAARPARIAVVNSFSPAFGDTVTCLPLLAELRRRLEARLGEVEIDLFQARFSFETDPLYQRSGLADGIHRLPAPVRQLAGYDGYLELSADHVDGALPWIDGCLRALGVEPETVPAARKRNRLAVDAEAAERVASTIAETRAGGRPVLLFHPKASTSIRSFPAERVRPFVEALLERTDYAVASAAPLGFSHPRVFDWSGVSRTFDDFVALIASADAFVTVDTSLYHVADAFDVPGVVLFTSIDPALRVAYYPFADGIQLRPGNRLLGTHFSEDPEDVAYAESLWDDLDADVVVERLYRVVARREMAREMGGWTEDRPAEAALEPALA